MPKRAKGLTARGVASERRAGMYADGKGLYLHVTATRAKSWIFRYQFGDRRRDMGLGSFERVSLAEARERAIDLGRKVKDGIDPLDEKKAATIRGARVQTFREVAEEYIEQHRSEWRDRGAAWEAMSKKHVYPIIGDRPVKSIDQPAVLEVLNPIWATMTKTATSVRNKIELILAYATVRNYRAGDNPARWRDNLDHILAKPQTLLNRREQHRAALPFADMPSFMAELRDKQNMTALAIEFTILTAARANEVRGARWAEIDLGAAKWTIPGSRMKSGKEHTRPLSGAAIEVLNHAAKLRISDIVFPGNSGQQMGRVTFGAMLTRMHPGITLHGFRSTFRDWAAERTAHRSEIIEMALAHTVGNAVERAYLRSDLLDRRRKLAQDWADFLDGRAMATADVVPLRA